MSVLTLGLVPSLEFPVGTSLGLGLGNSGLQLLRTCDMSLGHKDKKL